jgi:7-keto-8-aminopelargonate synthetase-like enzyme
VIRECIGIIGSSEGDILRADLMRNVDGLRALLAAEGLQCMGIPSPIVPVLIGSEKVSRLVGRLLFDQAVFVNQVEFPGVPVGASRLRLQLMSNHNMQQIKRAAPVIGLAVNRARQAIAAAEARQQRDQVQGD